MGNKAKIQPRILKGFRDYLPPAAIARSEMIDRIKAVFAANGFVPIDTPALEYADILLGKGSAETDKQLYRFMDNGERDIALRFDLTVPLARYAAMHIHELGVPFKRYHIAPVWRAEKPQRGRFREFFQCDFDVIGTKSILADAEIVLLISETFQALGISHRIRLNNRRVLNGFLSRIGGETASGAVLRAIDKLEKLGQEAVAAELSADAGLSNEQISSVFEFLRISRESANNEQVLEQLRALLGENSLGQEGAEQLELVHRAATRAGMPEGSLVIDLSIARGLDYYTGSVFETTLTELPQIGSVCSGGRYDNLASLYTDQELPGVGASVGLDRLLAALEELGKLPQRGTTAQVLVSMVDEASAPANFALARSLRQQGLAVETFAQAGRLGNQLKYADRKGIRYVVIAGEAELARECCSVKDMTTGKQIDDVPLAALAGTLREALSA